MTLHIASDTGSARGLSLLFLRFLGPAPTWYKLSILAFLLLNPLLLTSVGPFVTGWIIVAEFIFTLAMALKCYPLLSGGLIALEAMLLGLVTPELLHHEIEKNLDIFLLLMFMVAGIYFMKELLMVTFTKMLLGVKSKWRLSLLFCFTSAFLSAFLDALTVIAVVISVGFGFHAIFHRYASQRESASDFDLHDEDVAEAHKADLEQFRAFLRNLLMHAAVGTALGGVCTMVGEPQNLLIASRAGWNFTEFFVAMAPVTMPVLGAGLLVCMLLEWFGWFGYGARLPDTVRTVLEAQVQKTASERTRAQVMNLWVQALVGVWLVIALATHLAPVGLIGLSVIVLTTTFMGVTEEHHIGEAFTEALPFSALLVVFFAVVGIIESQHLFAPVSQWLNSMGGGEQISMYFLANGLLSAISDNVFVATIYIDEAKKAFDSGLIDQEQFHALAIAINTGTNIPSIATPNGQAAFLFLLTSALAPVLRLSYGRMVWMALPYFVVMTAVAYVSLLRYLVW